MNAGIHAAGLPGGDESVLADGLARRAAWHRMIVLASGPRSTTIVGCEGRLAARILGSRLDRRAAGNAARLVRAGRPGGSCGFCSSRDDRDATKAAIAARLPPGFVVRPVDQLELAGTILRSTELALQFAGALSMAMAGFIVLNTLRMNFGERRRDMAVLRVLGVTARQLVRLHLIEGFCLGLIGAVLGLPLGLALGRGLSAVMQRLGGSPGDTADIPYGTMITALVVGPLVACAAALVPAMQSRSVSAAEALGNTELRSADRFPLWATLGVVMYSRQSCCCW
jgi:hypothetical protein